MTNPKLSRAEALATGQTRYFTGEPCKYGHVAERWTLSAACSACQKAAKEAIAERYKLARSERGD